MGRWTTRPTSDFPHQNNLPFDCVATVLKPLMWPCGQQSSKIANRDARPQRVGSCRRCFKSHLKLAAGTLSRHALGYQLLVAQNRVLAMDVGCIPYRRVLFSWKPGMGKKSEVHCWVRMQCGPMPCSGNREVLLGAPVQVYL